MKKILAVMLAVMMVVSLAACGGASDGGANSSSGVKTGSNKKATIEETVLVDEAGVKITATELSEGGFFGSEVKLLIENNSGKDLTFQSRNASVNGYMVETMMSVDVVDGKKANDSITFMNSDMEMCNIKTIADMEFSFHIFTTSEWETYLDTEKIQLKTSVADAYEYTYDDSGEKVYENNDVKIVVKGLAEDSSIFGPSIVVYIENNRADDITVQSRDVSVNGFMLSSIFSSEITAGKRCVDTITFLSDDLEENNITAIEDVELSFHIFDTESWKTIVDTDLVSVTF